MNTRISSECRPSGGIARAVIALVSGLVLLGLAACATTGTGEDRVVERAQARWQALLNGDLDTAYSYYSPGYRATKSRTDFEVELRLKRVKWTSATYREHQCEENRCIVTFDVGYRVARPVPGLDVWDGKSVVRDTWVRSNGEWWFVPDKS